MEISPLYIIGLDGICYRQGDTAEIIGVKLVIPQGYNTPNPCYHVQFRDGDTDYIPISVVHSYHYKFVNEHGEEVRIKM